MKIKSHSLLTLIILLNGPFLFSQSTEDFELETTSAIIFTDNSQGFTITNGVGETTYDIEFFANGGWNGSTSDNKFIDNSSGNPTQNDGSSFTISTTNGTDITIKSLYLFVAKRNLTTGVSTTLTITGKRNGVDVYTIVKSSGIIDGAAFTPNNGFTFIDFSSEGGTDNSNLNVDELTFSTTGNADYLALDAFTWDAEVLSINNLEIDSNQVFVMPNPASNYIQLSKLSKNIEYTIFNSLGKKLSSGTIIPNQKIDISKLNAGLYFIEIEHKKAIKFIIK